MKIRADFVTNSSSSSYVDIKADNPFLEKLREEEEITSIYLYDQDEQSYMFQHGDPDYDIYYAYVSDGCSTHESLTYPGSLMGYLNLIAHQFQYAIKTKKKEILSNFRYAKFNTGYRYTDGELFGEEHHVTLSSRWGVFDCQTFVDKHKDPGNTWNEVECCLYERPSEEYAGFEGARPEDLLGRSDLSKKKKLILDNLHEGPVEISDKEFIFLGEYQKNRGYWGDEDHYVVEGNLREIEMIRKWVSPLGGRILALEECLPDQDADYVVIRLDDWAEDTINIDDINSTIERKIPIISEYQLWKTIFSDEKTESQR